MKDEVNALGFKIPKTINDLKAVRPMCTEICERQFLQKENAALLDTLKRAEAALNDCSLVFPLTGYAMPKSACKALSEIQKHTATNTQA